MTVARWCWLLWALLLASCDLKPSPGGEDRQQMLRELVTNVIVPIHAELAARSSELSASAMQLQLQPSGENVRAAQASYRLARGLYKQSEAFAYGPGDDLAITGLAIDSWPADGLALEALLAADTPLDAGAVARLPANQRGFPALEQLLFDSAVSEPELLERFLDKASATRRRELVRLLALELASRCRALHEAWAKLDGYGEQLAQAGSDSREFDSQSAAVDKILTGLVNLTEVMVMRKLAGPLGLAQAGAVQPQLEEAPRSDSSLDDLRNNLLAIQAVYTGERGERSGRGLDESVRSVNPGAAERFEQALAASFAAHAQVPPPLHTALIAARPAVESFYQSVRAVKQAVVVELASALGASIGFGYSDTD